MTTYRGSHRFRDDQPRRRIRSRDHLARIRKSRHTRYRAAQRTARFVRTVNSVPRTATREGSVVLADVPFEDGTGSKFRPVIVLCSSASEAEVLPCTTKIWRRHMSFPVRDLQCAGLIKPSAVNCERRVKIQLTSIVDLLGQLSADDLEGVRRAIRPDLPA